MAVLRMINSLSHVLSVLLNPGGLPCPAAAVAIANAEAGETEQWGLSAACPGHLKKKEIDGEAHR